VSKRKKGGFTDFSPLEDILEGVDRPGRFCTSGTEETPLPDMEIEGVGPLSFPLPPEQASKILRVAERAPYGRGADTLVDTDVRRTWQIAPEQIKIRGHRWEGTLRKIVERAAGGLGCGGKAVHAELYKGLLYDEGSFFIEHRDTEKSPGMFATLVIVLPSRFRGGELVVKHKEQSVTLALQGEDVGQVSYGAFFADCLHELRPVTEGYRFCLVYNLVAEGNAPRLRAPDYSKQTKQAVEFLRTWSDVLLHPGDDQEKIPKKLLYVLEHKYTQAGLSFAGLKNGDAAVASVLQTAAQEAGCDFWLAMVSISESGSAEPVYHGRRRYYEEDEEENEEDFEEIEVHERTQEITHWRAPDDSSLGLQSLPFEEDELCPPDVLEGEEPDEKSFTEATGNAGGSFERAYRRAALVLWPRQLRMTVLAEAKLDEILPFLLLQSSRWHERGASVEAPEYQELRDLAGQIFTKWPREPFRRSFHHESQEAALLDSLIHLRETGLLRRALAEISAVGRYNGGENKAIVRASDLLGWEAFAPLLLRICEGNRLRRFQACAELLGLLLEHRNAPEVRDACRSGARVLLAQIPGDPAAVAGLPAWERPEPPGKALTVTLLALLWALDDPELDAQVTERIVTMEKVYPPEGLLLPALVELSRNQGKKVLSRPGFQRLARWIQSFLEARVAEPLEAPKDWVRTAEVNCPCADCKGLVAFLASPTESVWHFRAAEARRRHIEQKIQAYKCDVDLKTERRGSPLTLICTKNQRSYDQRSQQRKDNLEELERVKKLLSL
jgi:hypothetical protein